MLYKESGSINPWEKISLSDYENHMSLESVYQLQALNEIMAGQMGDCEKNTGNSRCCRWGSFLLC